MRKDSCIKFRATRAQKDEIEKAAVRAGETVSVMLRRTALLIAAGRSDNRTIRSDMAKVRQAANLFASLANEGRTLDTEAARKARRAADEIHSIASRHLGVTS